ncbi:MAG TPA: hypothetical protein VHT52_17930 [Stellaceae bacterium]|jgi:hypothetical protein|nr:hypothetical protein [Stellaceae bacterium]
MPRPYCTDCRYYVNNGVAHCNNPKVARAVETIMGNAPVAEMQIHFIRFTAGFCGLDADWFEERYDAAHD